MKTKYTTILALTMLYLLVSSCEKWLDVGPSTEVSKKEMFKTQKGFQDALTGAYLDLKTDALYGLQLTWDAIEYMAQHWDAETDNGLPRYNYRDSKVATILDAAYAKFYTVIADVNIILDAIDNNDVVFEDGVHDLIKGEALALRAFCHFDILRLWGPIPQKTSTKYILPYVKTVTINNHPFSTFQEYTDQLLADLNAADTLLANIDPICKYSLEALGTPGRTNREGFNPENTFWAHRQVRMNYYSVLGLKSRFYLWLGNKPMAYKYAKLIIDAKTQGGSPTFRLGTRADVENTNAAFTCEHIASVYSSALGSSASSAFGGTRYYRNKELISSELFDAGTSDIRFSMWKDKMAGSEKRFVNEKFIVEPASAGGQIPLIRLAEMYLIAIECTTDSEEATDLYKAFCTSRNTNPVKIVAGATEDLILKEYNKEFYAEGQMFFTYKRLNSSSILWYNHPTSDKVYVVPLPQNENRYN